MAADGDGQKYEGVKLPSFNFYPGDWVKDPNLRLCGLHSKGALIEIMCLGFELPERGVLRTNASVWTAEEIAAAITGGGTDRQSASKAVHQLISTGVLKRRDADGAYYIARMVRDEEIRQKRAAGGVLGGNPALLTGRSPAPPPKVNLPPNLMVNLNPNLISNLPPESENENEPSVAERGSGGKPGYWPASETEAADACERAGVPREVAIDYYLQCDGRGRLDGAGQPITSFVKYATSRFRRTQRATKESNGNYRPNTGQVKRNVGIIGDPEARRAAIQAAMRAQSAE